MDRDRQPDTRSRRRPAPPVPTLREIQRSNCWLWMTCSDYRCSHHAAMTLAWAVITYGPDASSDVLRANGRCRKCGRRGALLQTPSWVNSIIGEKPFPADRAWPDYRPAPPRT